MRRILLACAAALTLALSLVSFTTGTALAAGGNQDICNGRECSWQGSTYLETKTSGAFTNISATAVGSYYYLKEPNGSCLTYTNVNGGVDKTNCTTKTSDEWWWAYDDTGGIYVFYSRYLGGNYCLTAFGNGSDLLMKTCPEGDPGTQQEFTWVLEV
jgi:hypothetical protein